MPFHLSWILTEHGYYKLSLFDGAIDAMVIKYEPHSTDKVEYWGAWEIVVGCNYFSRDKDRYYQDPSDAIRDAEKLIRNMGKQIVKVFGDEQEADKKAA